MKKLIELKTEFTKNGIETAEKISTKKAIVHTQLHKEDGYYIYHVNYSGNVHYVVFKEEFNECSDMISVIYPSDLQFYKGTAVNYTNAEDALAQIEEWKNENN
jgi:hypothetical protein